MTANDLAQSAASDIAPPDGLSDAVKALWLAKAGRWEAAHDLAQEIPTAVGAWIHAYLHRKEDDSSNAAYWYSRAGKKVSKLTLEQEWFEIASELL